MLVLPRELPVFVRQRKGSFRAWLRGIVLNQLRYALRRAKRTPIPAGQSDQLYEHIEQLADPSSDATLDFDREHDKAVFRRAAEIVKAEIKDSTWRAFHRHAMQGKDDKVVSND